MKSFIKLRIALMLALLVTGMISAWGQTVSNPLTVNGVTMSKNGTNSSGAVVGTESPDLITKGTRVPYLVIPDQDLNPDWDQTDPTNVSDVTSTWTWSGFTTIGAISGTSNKHYILFDVSTSVAAGTTATINVKEQSTVSCPDATGTDIDVKVVAQPTASALAVADASAPLTSVCVGGTGDLNVAFPTFTLTQTIDAAITATGSKGVKVVATLSFTPLNGTSSDLFADKILNVSDAGVINTADFTAALASLTDFDNWGAYTLTIKKISDKISRKDLNTAGGYFDVTGVSATYTVYKTPKTGEIYHVPNN